MTPIPDSVAGANLPYRGQVNHGVPYDGVNPIDESQYWSEEETDYEDEAQAVDPIPVRVVNRGAREINRFSTRQFTTAIGVPIQVADRNESRTSITIKCGVNDPLFIGDANISLFSGFRLDPSVSHVLKTTEPVYVISSAVDTFTVLEEWSEAVE